MIDETFWNTTLTWNITSLLFVYINCVLNEVDKVGWYRAVEKFDDFVLWGIFAKLFFEYLHKICFKVSNKNSFEPLEPLLDLFSSITFSSALLVALIFQASLKDCKTFYREKVSTLKVETLLG